MVFSQNIFEKSPQSIIIFIFGFLFGHLFQGTPTVDDIKPAPIVQQDEPLPPPVRDFHAYAYDAATPVEANFTKALIPRQGSDLITAPFNPEETFGIKLFEKKTCECGGRKIHPFIEMPEIFDQEKLSDLSKFR